MRHNVSVQQERMSNKNPHRQRGAFMSPSETARVKAAVPSQVARMPVWRARASCSGIKNRKRRGARRTAVVSRNVCCGQTMLVPSAEINQRPSNLSMSRRVARSRCGTACSWQQVCIVGGNGSSGAVVGGPNNANQSSMARARSQWVERCMCAVRQQRRAAKARQKVRAGDGSAKVMEGILVATAFYVRV